MKAPRNEQGGVLSFILISFVLTALLVGGVLLAKQQARLARGASETSTTQETSNTPPVSEEQDNDRQAAPNNSPSGTTSDNGNGSLPISGPSEIETIPSAGPANVVASAVSLGAATAGVYMFVQSNRRVRDSALK